MSAGIGVHTWQTEQTLISKHFLRIFHRGTQDVPIARRTTPDVPRGCSRHDICEGKGAVARQAIGMQGFSAHTQSPIERPKV